jgi:hypothetical protein
MKRRTFLATAAAATLTAQTPASPQAYLKKVLANGNLSKQGEDFCWHGAYAIHDFLRFYRASGDTAWLDAGVSYYEFLLSRIATGPDGYKGWIGPYEYDNSVWCDAHVGDAILCNGMVAFAEVVLADPRLAAVYSAYAKKYVSLAGTHLFEKWDSRGTWEQDGPYGAYRSWNRYGPPGGVGEWQRRDDINNSNLAHPFNKQDDVAAVALKLYRITGDAKYRDRAQSIFAFQKSRFQLIDDRYVWNYWEPFGARDVDLAAGKTRHWVGVHPNRNYQEGEVANIVEAYHTGIVFDETDIRRILATNLKIMWNGSFDAPAFHNSNFGIPGIAPNQIAGCLWTALADFDETVRKLGKITLPYPPGFNRRMLHGAPTVFDYPFSSCTELNMVAALPAYADAATGTLLASGNLVRGATDVSLYTADGSRQLAAFHVTNRFDRTFYQWTGAAPGSYRIRWTFNHGSYREAPVNLR